MFPRSFFADKRGFIFSQNFFSLDIVDFCYVVGCLKLKYLFVQTASNKKDKAEWTWSGLAELVKYSRVSSHPSFIC